jgi:hypothetical protein
MEAIVKLLAKRGSLKCVPSKKDNRNIKVGELMAENVGYVSKIEKI